MVLVIWNWCLELPSSPSPQAGEGGGEGEHILSTPALVLPHQWGGQ
jgi:hypothetical protein